jgi:Uroporphyrinogen-III decarboxylase
MNFEKTDRPPVVLEAAAFCARMAGVSMARYCADGPGSVDVQIKCWRSFTPLIDGVQSMSFHVSSLNRLWLSKVKVAGVDLPEDEMWQVEEEELMTVEDYDRIIEGGFDRWYQTFLEAKVYNPKIKGAGSGDLAADMKKFIDVGIAPLADGVVTIPLELFCGGRSMAKFMMDLYRRPDQVREAMAAAAPSLLEKGRTFLRTARPMGIWVGGWRSASQMLSPKMWEDMVWPYFKKAVEMVVEEGAIPLLHLDSDWTRDLDYFRELPKYKCIMCLDGSTDIRRARKTLDHHTCLAGDVPASLLAFGRPSEVTAYVRNLIDDLGPGYMVASGCDIPFNAQKANVEAMIRAAHDC